MDHTPLVHQIPGALQRLILGKLDCCSSLSLSLSLSNARMLESKNLGNFNFFHKNLTILGDEIICLQKHSIDTVFHLAAHMHADLGFGGSYTWNYQLSTGELYLVLEE
jgi:hypothetical protein